MDERAGKMRVWLRRGATGARWILTLLSALVLMLLVRSYKAGDVIGYFGPPLGFEFISGGGSMSLYVYDGFENVRTPWIWKGMNSSQRYTLDSEHVYSGEHGGVVLKQTVGVRALKGGTYYNNPAAGTQTHVTWREVSAPLGLVAVVLLAWPAYHVLVPWRRRRVMEHRRAAGLCLNCGYDLRGGGERCPECGTSSSVSAVLA